MALLPGGISTEEGHGAPRAKGCIRSWKPWTWRTKQGHIIGAGDIGPPLPAFGTPELQYIVDWIINAGNIASAAAYGSATVHNADEIWAASPAFADVQAAVAAASPGDTVRIPAGFATWLQYLPSITKPLTILGAGIDQTIIKRGFTNTNDTGSPTRGLISFSLTSGYAATNPDFGIGAMTIDCDYRGDGVWFANYYRQYPLTKIRLHHMKIHHATYSGSPWGYNMFGISVGRTGAVYGVCDNCIINSDLISNTGDDDFWTDTAYNFGNEHNFYFEDCEWTSTPTTETLCSDGNHSPRYAFRRNIIDCRGLNRGYLSPMMDLHGNQASPMRAGQGLEVYENAIICGDKGVLGLDLRGGKGLVFNNVVTTTGSGSFSLRVREEHNDATVGPSPLIANNVITGQPQHISDTYFWNNTINGARVDADDSAEHVTYGGVPCPSENVHFWNEVPAFNGSVGIGRGLLSARPSSGLTIGVGYWATDTRTLYRATGAATWEAFYAPYTYPHPLRGLAQNSFFVDTANALANDSNNGSELRPWKTITKANAALVAGDTVYIKAGTYAGQYVAPANSGTPGNRITYFNYGIDAVAVSNSTEALYLNGKSYITVWNIKFSNCDRFLKMFNASTHNIIAYCDFDQVRNRSDWSGSSITGNSTHNWLHHCRFSKYGEIISGDDRACVLDIGTEENSSDASRYNLIEDSVLFHGGHHVLGVYSKYNTIRRNYFHNDAWLYGNADRGWAYYGDRNVYFAGLEPATGQNLFENNRLGYTADPPDQVGVTNFLLVQSKNIVRFNSFYHSIKSGLALGLTSSYVSDIVYNKIYNNTLFHGGLYGDNIDEDAALYLVNYHATHVIQNNAFKNNLMYKNWIPYGFDGSAASGDQIWAGNYDGDSSGDPLFVNASETPGDPMDSALPDLSLQSGSPCRNAGTYLTQASGSGASSLTLVVGDAGYFQDGTWGPPDAGIQPDWIAIGTVTNVVQVASINYATNTITLASPMTWANNAPVWLYKDSSGRAVLTGAAPNIGAL